MYLIDTNIFLEILLSQKQKDICKEFLLSNIERQSKAFFEHRMMKSLSAVVASLLRRRS